MAGRLRRIGAQQIGRVPRAGDPRAARNAAAHAAEYIQDGEGLSRDSQGRLRVDFTDPETGAASKSDIATLQTQIDELRALIEAGQS